MRGGALQPDVHARSAGW